MYAFQARSSNRPLWIVPALPLPCYKKGTTISYSSSLPSIMPHPAYRLGCPVWACARWAGRLFTHRAKRPEWLTQYSRVFHTVEANSTFYGLPSHEAVRRWADAVDDDFRFALKFPQEISHQKRLLNAQRETEDFLQLLQILKQAGRLGPSYLQLPGGFAPYHFADLEKYLRGLPAEFPYALEVRHRGFYEDTAEERELNHLLMELHIDRVLLDTRPLFCDAPSDESEAKLQASKPQLPVAPVLTARHPFIRLIGRNDSQLVMPWVREWAQTVASWIVDGLRPYVFAHTPDEVYSPDLARLFHEELMQHTQRVNSMRPWPGEQEQKPARQLELF